MERRRSTGWIALLTAAALPLPAASQSVKTTIAIPEIAAPVAPIAAAPSNPVDLRLSPALSTLRARSPVGSAALKTVVAPIAAVTRAGAIASSERAVEAGPPYTTLPESIRPDFLEQVGFVEFTELADQKTRFSRNGRSFTNTPIGSGFHFGGKKLAADSDAFRALRRTAFEESGWAYVPPGRRIRVSRDVLGREHWEYPEGMTFIDSIRIRGEGAPVYELRMITRLAGGEWAFATYSYEKPGRPAAGERLARALYEGTPPVEISFGRAGAEHDIKFFRTNLKSCQACHFHNSVAGYQYEKRGADGAVDVMASRAQTGPSGFVPSNEAIQGEWARDYAKRWGHFPFSEAAAAQPIAARAPLAARVEIYVDGLR
ncbi:MAG: hypothetical protein HY925_06970 [Elusimicrobia bacterium]|nr:hypothetical protein [Elusimicrobiota bacterium]